MCDQKQNLWKIIGLHKSYFSMSCSGMIPEPKFMTFSYVGVLVFKLTAWIPTMSSEMASMTILCCYSFVFSAKAGDSTTILNIGPPNDRWNGYMNEGQG